MTPNGHDTDTKRHLLKKLNAEARSVQTALNQAQSAVTYAQRLVEQSYLRKRTAIINARDDDDWELQA